MMPMASKPSVKQGTQAGHAVTNSTNHTKVVSTPAQSMPANSTKPMSADDKYARKKYGSKSWNNGYTN